MGKANFNCVYCGTNVIWFSQILNGRCVFLFRTPIETAEACTTCACIAENTRVVLMEKIIEIKERINSIKKKIIKY